MKLGLHSVIFPESLNVLQKIEYTAKTGYDAIELETGPFFASSSRPPRNVVARFLDKEARSEIIGHAKNYGVKIRSLCFGMFVSPYYHIVDPDPRYRDLAVSQIVETIGLARDFESDVILVFVPETSPMRRLLTNDQKRDLLRESLLKLVRFAEDAGVVIGLEPSAPSFFAGWKDILSAISSVNSESIACYYDVGNAANMGFQPDEEMLKLGNAIIQIHVKELRLPPEKVVPRFPSIGQGAMDWDRIFSSLKSIDYQRYLIVELYPDPADPYRVARESKKFLEKYISQSL